MSRAPLIVEKSPKEWAISKGGSAEGIRDDTEKVNVHGIALAANCVGFGQGPAVILERWAI